jgi:hypothetical protein
VKQNENQNGKRIYNLSGQRLQDPPAHGLYIENGRKVLR